MTKRKALSIISSVYNLYTAQIFIEALFEDCEDSFLYGAWEAKQFDEYAKEFGINRKSYKIDTDTYGVKEVA